MKEQGLWRTGTGEGTAYTDVLDLDSARCSRASRARSGPGPGAPRRGEEQLPRRLEAMKGAPPEGERGRADGGHRGEAAAGVATAPAERRRSATARWSSPPSPLHEHSNPSVMMRRAPREEGRDARLASKPWVKTSLGLLEGGHRLPERRRRHALPRQARVQPCRLRLHHLHREQGPLPAEVSRAIKERGLVAVSVLSGNRNLRGV